MVFVLLIKATPRQAQRCAAAHGLCLRIDNFLPDSRNTIGTVVSHWRPVISWFHEHGLIEAEYAQRGYPEGTLLHYRQIDSPLGINETMTKEEIS